ncbi:MAG: hypothetical protein KatS3mg124_0923 [Porticoccaceae bacterium]|nr:MAG: hypothetical protein KatS3mg124_0923 [Porticoccaceae bacterium]
MAIPSAPEEPSRQGPGGRLQVARARRALSAEAVCRELGLGATQLAALEADAWDRLPRPVFVVGWLRRYAALVGLDAEPLVADYLAACGERPTPAPPPPGRPPRPRAVALLAALLCGASSLVFAALFTDSGGRGKGARTPASSERTVVRDPRLELRFDSPSWVEVVDGRGRMLAAEMASAGGRLELAGEPPFRILLGDPAGVTVRFGGESGPPGDGEAAGDEALAVGP